MISLLADRRDIAAGARAMVPWLAGVAPFGLVDPSLAVGLDGYGRLGRGQGHAHYFGGAAQPPPHSSLRQIGLTCPDLDITGRLIQAGTDWPIRRPEGAHGLRDARGFAVPASSGCLAGDSAAVPGPFGRQARRRPDRTAAPAWGPAAWRRSV